MENINTQTEMSTIPSFGFNGFGSSFLSPVLGVLLGAAFGGLTLPTLSGASDEKFNDYVTEFPNASEEEKQYLLDNHIDPDGIMEKYIEKLKDPIETAKLNKKLAKIDERIAHWNKKRQDIVDEWARS